MKKKKGLATLLLIIFISIIVLLINNSEKETKELKKEVVKNINMLTMMLETEAGTGIYEETKASEWPTDGYVFNTELSKCENGATLSWDDENKKVVMESNTGDKCYVYFDIANQTFADYIINGVYTEDGTNGLYYHDGIGTYTNANQEAGDNSYRYSGANPNNYVCFGSNTETCPNDNLYRIIGLFDDDKDGTYNIKLIKNTSIGDYVWNSEDINAWNASTKPSIRTTLNSTFLGTINSTWQEKIATQNWKVVGMVYSTTNTAKQYYDTEIKNQTGYNETMAVGLMYVSDYGYSSSPENWQIALCDYDNTTNTNNNWMYLGAEEWTISRRMSNTSRVYYVASTGYVRSSPASTARAVRPSVYLKSEVALEGGTGSASDPYRVSL